MTSNLQPPPGRSTDAGRNHRRSQPARTALVGPRGIAGGAPDLWISGTADSTSQVSLRLYSTVGGMVQWSCLDRVTDPVRGPTLDITTRLRRMTVGWPGFWRPPRVTGLARTSEEPIRCSQPFSASSPPDGTDVASCLHSPLSWSPDGQWLVFTVAQRSEPAESGAGAGSLTHWRSRRRRRPMSPRGRLALP